MLLGRCLNTAADKLAAIMKAHGPESIGFYGSGQLLTEDYYVFNKAGQRLDWHQQHRHEFSSVHEQRSGRLQSHLGC